MGGVKIKVVVAVVLAVVVALAIMFWPRPDGEQVANDSSGDTVDASQLDLTRVALSATENLEMNSAEQAWQELYQQSPADPSLLQNRALNRILLVDELSGKATNASLDAAAKQDARSKLPDAISKARAAIDDFTESTSDPVLPLWMRTRIDLQEASLLPASMTKSLRREIYGRLSDAVRGPVGEMPAAKIVGGSLMDVLSQMEDPIDGLPSDLRASAAETLQILSDRHPDNLYFALRAARLNIETKNLAAAPLAARTGELASALAPMLARETRAIGMTPAELVADIQANIEAGQWQPAETRMLQWFNVLNGTEIVKTDRRLSTPHPLDRLSFGSLRKLSSSLAADSPVTRGSKPFTFDKKQLDAPESQSIVELIDFDLDLDVDMISVNEGSTLLALRNDGKGNFAAAGSVKLDFLPTGIVIADLFVVDSSSPDRLRGGDSSAAKRHNTLPCLVLYSTEKVALVMLDGRPETTDEKRFVIVEGDTGLSDVGGVIAAVAGDLEADGDLDLVFATENEGIRAFVNRGNRTFFELPRQAKEFGKDDPATGLAIADLDRDLDLDVVTTHRSGKIGLLENLLHLQFRSRYLDDIEPVAGASAIAVEEVDGNVSWDLVIGGTESTTIVFSQTADAGSWTIDHIESAKIPAPSMVVADFDNDSWLDVLSDQGVTPIGPWGFGETIPVSLVDTRSGPSDVSGDGLPDFAQIEKGRLSIAMNRTDSKGHHVDIRFKGIDDNASGRVNHFAIGSVLELRFGPHYRAQIVTSPSTHFGTDGFDGSGSIRAILPNGLTQTISKINPDTLVEEEQTLKGSCPFLYAWDGNQFQFVTDCLWAAPLGLQVADGIVAKDRPWEYLKLSGDAIRPRGDQYEFRVTEELWEVAYFDEIKLSAIDHPANVDVWTNEKVGPGGIATPTIFAFDQEDRRPPTRAIDGGGRDVTAQILLPDKNFVQGFDRRIRQGLCPPHWVDLDFEKLPADGNVYLVMTGWIMPTDTSLNIQIDQNADLAPIEFPSIWVPDGSVDGGWRNAIPFAGFPGGKTKTIVIDVSDAIDRDNPRLRVRTSAQIYWDAAEVAVQTKPAEYRKTDLELVASEVGSHGFSRRIRNGSTQPETYDYQDTSLTPRWPPLRGELTRKGECLDLLRKWDDRMVVIGAGDEVRLSFSVPSIELPDGWVRDFVMHNVGWDKDADLNTLAGQTIGPLPYRSMTSYPPPIDQADAPEMREELNRDHLQRKQSYREFWYRPDNRPDTSTSTDD